MKTAAGTSDASFRTAKLRIAGIEASAAIKGITKRIGPLGAASKQATTFGALLARLAASNSPLAMDALLATVPSES